MQQPTCGQSVVYFYGPDDRAPAIVRDVHGDRETELDLVVFGPRGVHYIDRAPHVDDPREPLKGSQNRGVAAKALASGHAVVGRNLPADDRPDWMAENEIYSTSPAGRWAWPEHASSPVPASDPVTGLTSLTASTIRELVEQALDTRLSVGTLKRQIGAETRAELEPVLRELVDAAMSDIGARVDHALAALADDAG